MQLRTNIRLPGRYRDVEDAELVLPPNPTFVHPTVPYDPNLRPAVFPTIPLDQSPPEESATATPDSKTSEPNSPVIQRRNNKQEPRMPAEIQEPHCDQEPRYDGMAVGWEDDQGAPLPRYGLPAHEAQITWEDLSEGMQFIIIQDLSKELPLQDAFDFLQLQDQQMITFMDLVIKQVRLENEQHQRVQDYHTKSIDLLMSADYTPAKYKALQDEAHSSNHESPSVYSITPGDVKIAKDFLADFRYREEFPGYGLNPSYNSPFPASQQSAEDYSAEMNAIPKYKTLKAIIGRLDRYKDRMIKYRDLDFEMGYFDLWFDTMMELSMEEMEGAEKKKTEKAAAKAAEHAKRKAAREAQEAAAKLGRENAAKLAEQAAREAAKGVAKKAAAKKAGKIAAAKPAKQQPLEMPKSKNVEVVIWAPSTEKSPAAGPVIANPNSAQVCQAPNKQPAAAPDVSNAVISDASPHQVAQSSKRKRAASEPDGGPVLTKRQRGLSF